MKTAAVVVITIGIFGGLFLAAWLGGYVMLYQGICQAIAAEGAAKVGPILKAVFCEVGVALGVTFGGLLGLAGFALWRGGTR